MFLDSTPFEMNDMFYQKFADKFDKIPFKKVLPKIFLDFTESLEQKDVLEIGSGPGAFAFWMKDQGCRVICIDPSEEMVKRCLSKGLVANQKTIQEFQTDQTFNIIVAINSLIHIPKEERDLVFSKIHSLLEPEGLVFLSIFLGETSYFADPTSTGLKRFFCDIEKQEFLMWIKDRFQILYERNILIQKMEKEAFFCVLKKSR